MIENTKKVLTLFCQVFYPDEQSTAQLFADWTVGMVADGWSIRVVCGYPPKGEGVPHYEVWKGVEICRVGIRLDFKKSLWMRALHYAAYLLAAGRELLRNPERLVLVVTNPPFFPIWASIIRKLCRGRYAIEVQDLYPDGLVALGKLSDGWLAKVWSVGNRVAFRRAEAVVVLGRDMAERLEKEYGVAAEKICVIPHWSPVEPGRLLRPEKTRVFSSLGFEGKFLVQYSGNMGLWHDMEQIVGAAKELRGMSDLCFVMIGEGRRKAAAEALAKAQGCMNMLWLPFQDKEDLVDSLSSAHVALISQRKGLEGVAVPCKLYGILACGRAVIAAVPAASEVARVVSEEGCGIVVPPGDVKAMVGAIKFCREHLLETEAMGQQAREAYLKKYTLRHAVERFGNFFV